MKLILALAILLLATGCSTMSPSQRANWLDKIQREQAMQDDYDRAIMLWIR